MKRSFNSCCVTVCESCSTSATTSVPGCCHIQAMNYDPLATCDDGTTCCYCDGAYVQQLTPTTLTANDPSLGFISGGYWTIGTYTINYNFTNCPNFPVGQDLTVTASYNGITYDPGEGAVITFVPCAQTPTITVVDNTTGCTAELQPIPNTYGCMEPTASNYNPSVMCSDGSCVWLGCTDPAANNYDPTATVDDGSCTYTGCMDPGSSNYNPNATTPCVSCCIPCIYGCMDPNATNYYLTPGQSGYDPTVTCPCTSCCVPEVLGCTDPTATNYDPLANTDDGSCIYCVYGCTDSTAVNYDALATCDDGSCCYSSLIVTLEVKDVFPGQTNGEILATVTGGTAPYTYLWSDGQTTNPATGLPLGPYTVTVTDANGCTVTDEAFVLINIVYGCTDPLATNYSFIYNTDDGSCIYSPCHIPDSNFRNVLPNFNSLINVNSWLDVNGVPTVGGEYINVNLVNTITILNIQSQNIASLTGIECFTALTHLECWNNQLTSLNVSQNTALTYLDCQVNQLTSLNVNGANALTYLNCNYNQLTSLNVSQNTALTELYCWENLLISLDVSQNTALTYLNCWDNQLSSLDVSQNTALFDLGCADNQLTSLDVSQNTALIQLWCHTNQLTSLLDVSQNTALIRLECQNNQLSSLDVRNGNNTNFIYFKSDGNPNLYCIDVDNDAWSTANWLQHDPWASFSNDCSATNITNTIWTKFNKL